MRKINCVKQGDVNLIVSDVIMVVVFYGQVFVMTFVTVQMLLMSQRVHAKTLTLATHKLKKSEARKIAAIIQVQRDMKSKSSDAQMGNVFPVIMFVMEAIIVETILMKVIVKKVHVFLEHVLKSVRSNRTYIQKECHGSQQSIQSDHNQSHFAPAFQDMP